MKKVNIFYLIFILFFLIPLLPKALIAQEADKSISVTVDGAPVSFDVQPVSKNNRTLVPFRALAEALDINVDWNSSNQKIIATNSSTIIDLQIGNKNALNNNQPIELDMEPILLNGRALVPLRFFSEAFGCEVSWDPILSKVSILSALKDIKVIGYYALGDKNTSSWTNLFQAPYPQSTAGNTDLIKNLALGWYSLDRNGNILTHSTTGWQRPSSWEMVLLNARQYGLKSEMVIHVTDKDSTISNFIANNTAIDNLLNQILGEARLYSGVNLDFEGLGWNESNEELALTKTNFTNFITKLSQHLKMANLKLTLTLHAPNSAYKGYDFQALGQIADEIIIMAYDYGQNPEPLSLVGQAIEMALNQVPSDKLVLGISLPNETPESIKDKITLAKNKRLKGIALWRLGLISEEMFKTMRTTLNSQFMHIR